MRNKDVNGSLRLAELKNTFDFVFSYASPEGTITGRLLYDLLGFWVSLSIWRLRSWAAVFTLARPKQAGKLRPRWLFIAAGVTPGCHQSE
ncbi:hypothetical protein N185_34355 [Sinorhizobium sp. GW3]|nr:hypothetical protein N185_34355 [Sinorhizobium sp. GW3]